jgi:2-polyprenyl-6-methoxyphenol hydroxylase-like FAD-dependent oxidoreductase
MASLVFSDPLRSDAEKTRNLTGLRDGTPITARSCPAERRPAGRSSAHQLLAIGNTRHTATKHGGHGMNLAEAA